MLRKFTFVYCLFVSCLIFGLAAYLDTGEYMTKQPGIAWMTVVAMAISFAGAIPLRHRRDWPILGAASLFCALLMAIGMHYLPFWSKIPMTYYFIVTGAFIIGTIYYAFVQGPDTPAAKAVRITRGEA